MKHVESGRSATMTVEPTNGEVDRLLTNLLNELPHGAESVTFDELGIDSHALRVEIQSAASVLVPDTHWETIRSIADVRAYFRQTAPSPSRSILPDHNHSLEARTGVRRKPEPQAVDKEEPLDATLGESLGFRRFGDLQGLVPGQRVDQDKQVHHERRVLTHSEHHKAGAGADDRQYLVNMPQMAAGGLSEGWLFRELGDLHWWKLCVALDTTSDAIRDTAGNRLYAAFVRVRWESDGRLRDFGENDLLSVRGTLSRCDRTFFTDCKVSGREREIRASLVSMFVARNGENNCDLRRSDPHQSLSGVVPSELTKMPGMATQYHALRKGETSSIELLGETFAVPRGTLFEHHYAINPCYDINGVNLLYFASYPMISDTCERAYVHAHRREFEVRSDWALEASAVARDVFYFGNCGIDDTVVCQLNSVERLDSGRVKLVSTLRRSSDGQRIAVILTIKQRRN